MNKLSTLALVFALAFAGAVSAGDFFCTVKVKTVDAFDGGVSLLVESMGQNPAGLGKFVANIDESTELTQTIMCRPPQSATTDQIKPGTVLTITFDKIIETWPEQVDCKTAAIMGYPFADTQTRGTEPAVCPEPVAPAAATVAGTIVEIRLAKDLAHANTGMILIEEQGGGLLYLRVSQQTKIFVPGPACGPVPAYLNQLQVGWNCSATFSGPVLESMPPQVEADTVHAGFPGM